MREKEPERVLSPFRGRQIHVAPAAFWRWSAEITRLQKEMSTLRQINTDVLVRAEKLKKGTIEQALNLDEVELGRHFLLGDLTEQDQKKRD